MMGVWLGILLLSVAPEQASTAIVICAPEFRAALAPWEEFRRRQGTKLHFLTPENPAYLQSSLQALANKTQPTHVVIIGDVDARDPVLGKSIAAPAFHVPAKVNVLFGSEPEIASDLPYGDFDEDGIPDVAIGRISVDTPEQLKLAVKKIIDYETSRDFGEWRQRVQLVAGVGGFGALIDGTIENTAKQFLCHGIPAGYSTNMIYGSWRSPYCPSPRQFQETVLQKYNQGSLFWVYIGHGHPERLDRLHVPNAAYPILEKRDLARLKSQSGSPIAVLLSCYTGAYDFQRESLAEEMHRSPGGPVAVLAGSRVTMPYAMTILSHELLKEAFERRTPTLGEVLLHAKQNMVSTIQDSTSKETNDADPRQWIDALGKMFSPKPELLEAERYEHLALFNLLGDPLLRIAYPESIQLQMAEEVRGGEKLKIRLESPVAGRGTLQLVCRRDGLTFLPETRGVYVETPAMLHELQQTYERANDHRWIEHPLVIPAGKYEIELPIPEQAYGFCQVRVFLAGQNGHALGGSDLYVRRAKTSQAALKPVTEELR